MSGQVVTDIMLAVFATAVPLAAFYSATRATRSQARASNRAVDAGAYQRAKEIYDGALDAAHGEIEPLRLELVRCRAEIAGLQAEISRLRYALAAAQAAAADLADGNDDGKAH